jgi:Sodium:dicarboxylate symporter family
VPPASPVHLTTFRSSPARNDGPSWSAIVLLAATLNAVPSIPAIGLVLVLSVDWFIGMMRALGNLVGDCVATVVVAVWERELNLQLAARVLDSDVVVGGGEGCLTGLPRPRGQSKRAYPVVPLSREALGKHGAAQVLGDNGDAGKSAGLVPFSRERPAALGWAKCD